MNTKDKQLYISDNELGSREEVEVHEQRVKELEKYDMQEDKTLIIKLLFLQLC